MKTAVVKARAKANAAKAQQGSVVGKGLKISFRPADLNKTTEKAVASQVWGGVRVEWHGVCVFLAF